MKPVFFIVFSLIVGITSASAQELTFGLGASDYGSGGQDSVALDLEYRHAPVSAETRSIRRLGGKPEPDW